MSHQINFIHPHLNFQDKEFNWYNTYVTIKIASESLIFWQSIIYYHTMSFSHLFKIKANNIHQNTSVNRKFRQTDKVLLHQLASNFIKLQKSWQVFRLSYPVSLLIIQWTEQYKSRVGDNKPLSSIHVWFILFWRNNHLFLPTFSKRFWKNKKTLFFFSKNNLT